MTPSGSAAQIWVQTLALEPQLRTGGGEASDFSFLREDFFSWLWAEFSVHGLEGVHEGTVLAEEAHRAGLETESWTLDQAEAPRERDWVEAQSTQGELQVELFWGSEKGAELLREEISDWGGVRVVGLRTEGSQDWNAAWKQSFLEDLAGVQLGEGWRIVAPWAEPRSLESQLSSSQKWIRINPGAGFGTGTHETTQLCLEALSRSRFFPQAHASGDANLLPTVRPETLKAQSRFLDFGSGSGILAIGAALCGMEGDAVEIDELAHPNARENFELNQVSPNIELLQKLRPIEGAAGAHPTGAWGETYSLIFANILRPVLIAFAEELVKRLTPGGVLILSGMIESDLEQVRQVYLEAFERRFAASSIRAVAQVTCKNEWRALIFSLE